MTEDISHEELKGRVIYRLLTPAVRLACNFRIPLPQMKRWVETAYYHEIRRRGLSMREAMETMGVSLSKATLLSRQLKRNFAALEADYELPRRIEYCLWAGPLSAAKIAQHLGSASLDEVEAALEKLMEEGRATSSARANGAVYSLVTGRARRGWNTWLGRLDGLGDAMSSVTDAVSSRFFGTGGPSLARTVTFHARKADVSELQRFYDDEFFPRIVALDAAAEGAAIDETETLALSLFWARHGASVITGDEGDPQ